jgi:hypothetical protein
MKLLIQHDYFRLCIFVRFDDMTSNRVVVTISEEIDVIDVSIEI